MCEHVAGARTSVGDLNYIALEVKPCKSCMDAASHEGVRKGKSMTNNILTCVYCGMAYPEGTPPHGSQILTDHIKICEKHPMRESEAKIELLRKALSGIVGANTKEELEKMEIVIRSLPAPDEDKAVSINAIHALLKTMR